VRAHSFSLFHDLGIPEKVGRGLISQMLLPMTLRKVQQSSVKLAAEYFVKHFDSISISQRLVLERVITYPWLPLSQHRAAESRLE